MLCFPDSILFSHHRSTSCCLDDLIHSYCFHVQWVAENPRSLSPAQISVVSCRRPAHASWCPKCTTNVPWHHILPNLPFGLLLPAGSPNQLKEPVFIYSLEPKSEDHTDFPFCSIWTSNQAPLPADLSSKASHFLLFSIFITIILEETTTVSPLDQYSGFLTDLPDPGPVLPPQTHPQNGHQGILPNVSLTLIFAWKLPTAYFFTKQIPSFFLWGAIFHGHTSWDCTISCWWLPQFPCPSTAELPRVLWMLHNVHNSAFLFMFISLPGILSFSPFLPLVTSTSFGFKFKSFLSSAFLPVRLNDPLLIFHCHSMLCWIPVLTTWW